MNGGLTLRQAGHGEGYGDEIVCSYLSLCGADGSITSCSDAKSQAISTMPFL